MLRPIIAHRARRVGRCVAVLCAAQVTARAFAADELVLGIKSDALFARLRVHESDTMPRMLVSEGIVYTLAPTPGGLRITQLGISVLPEVPDANVWYRDMMRYMSVPPSREILAMFGDACVVWIRGSGG